MTDKISAWDQLFMTPDELQQQNPICINCLLVRKIHFRLTYVEHKKWECKNCGVKMEIRPPLKTDENLPK